MSVLWRRVRASVPCGAYHFQRLWILRDRFAAESLLREILGEADRGQSRGGQTRGYDFYRQERYGGLMADPALVTIGGGALAASLMIGVGSACAARNGMKAYTKARALVSHPVLVQARSLSTISTSIHVRGEELGGLVARAFVALERITEALAMLRDIFTRSSRYDPEAHSSRVRNSGN